ncbi:hypothetical protein G6F70_008422 [Rhizopus microsporus]|uniref:KxDL domain-containing protein n=1 Tax=Rhizopus microsporus TaxID=58291 RepID=A0A0A1P211_RHIZD|nr:hypothetical protein G6F71_008102 [Rhizopus microsporus]KAG1195191.1 hypothetical protein G6F70_008422 [Rhizopus microsporus]KAG1207022.1 hypothetical protein G6F69_008382 [Rhizopus microsporus]KAG1228244.1 hypothetical protein G6F67_007951 [Rhizopus microsporus]KAG1259597.1 hypothetical protein G6F68_008004 [Rhizopus microsporus]
MSQNIPKHVLNLKNEQEMQVLMSKQQECLKMYKQAEKNLEAFNRFSTARYHMVHKQFEQHNKLLKQIKKDLNSVFLKLNKIKNHLNTTYPNQYQQSLAKYPPPVLEDD